MNSTEVLLSRFLLFALGCIFTCTSFGELYFWYEVSVIPTLLIMFLNRINPARIRAFFFLLVYSLVRGCFFLLILSGKNFSNFGNVGLLEFIGLRRVVLVKTPVFLFHLWLLKAHVEAPTGVSIILARLILKSAGFFLIRVGEIYELNFSRTYLFIL